MRWGPVTIGWYTEAHGERTMSRMNTLENAQKQPWVMAHTVDAPSAVDLQTDIMLRAIRAAGMGREAGRSAGHRALARAVTTK